MKNYIKLISLSVTISLLSSCAVYQPPKSGSTATINFPGSDSFFSYFVRIPQNPYTCENPYPQPSEKFKIPAGKLFTFLVSYETNVSTSSTMVTYSSCNFAASFIPDKNQNYIVYFDTNKNRCTLSVREKLNSTVAHIYGSDELPVAVKMRNFKTGIAHPYCADKITNTMKFN